MLSHCGAAPRFRCLRPRPGLSRPPGRRQGTGVLRHHLSVAREGQGRQRVRRENADLEHLRAGAWAAATREAGLVRDTDHAGRTPFGDVVDADQAGQLNRGVDLLGALAGRRLPRVFVVVDEPARKAPQPAAWLDRATSEHHAAVDLDHDGGRDLRVVPQHEIVVGTCLDLATFNDAHHELGPAVHAVMAHNSNDRALPPPSRGRVGARSIRPILTGALRTGALTGTPYACCLDGVAFMSATRTWLRPPCLAA